MSPTLANVHPLWFAVTRLGEAEILFPTGLVCAWWLARQPGMRPAAWRWLAALGISTGLTLGSKLAFMGWGIGNAGLDFTGVSGHAMFSAAVYPLLLRLLAASRPPSWQRGAWLAGYGLALLVAVSRVKVEAHSWSEVSAGFCVGAAVDLLALKPDRLRATALPLAFPALFAIWMLFTTQAQAGAPTVNTNRMVARLAMAMSGRPVPYTRRDLHRVLPPPLRSG